MKLFKTVIILGLFVLLSSFNTSDWYKVDVSDAGIDLYHIEGTDLYIETFGCLELCIFHKALLYVDKTGESGSIEFENELYESKYTVTGFFELRRYSTPRYSKSIYSIDFRRTYDILVPVIM